MDSINNDRENSQYLLGYKLPTNLIATVDMKKALLKPDMVLFVFPTQVTRHILESVKHLIKNDVLIVVCSKGIEIGTHKLVSDIFLEILGNTYKNQLFFLSGPSFAKEIAERIPTAVTIAGYAEDKIGDVQSVFRSSYFKVYGTDDVIGVELSGALKNVIAIACGVSEGLGMGYNSQAALITRGLAEVARLGKVMGAKPLTFMGLAGMGDLVLTCTGSLSRNRTVGVRIGEGMSLENILDNMQQVVEGVSTTKSAYELAAQRNIHTPVIDGVYKVLYNHKSPRKVLEYLMSREYKRETE